MFCNVVIWRRLLFFSAQQLVSTASVSIFTVTDNGTLGTPSNDSKLFNFILHFATLVKVSVNSNQHSF